MHCLWITMACQTRADFLAKAGVCITADSIADSAHITSCSSLWIVCRWELHVPTAVVAAIAVTVVIQQNCSNCTNMCLYASVVLWQYTEPLSSKRSSSKQPSLLKVGLGDLTVPEVVHVLEGPFRAKVPNAAIKHAHLMLQCA